MLVVAISSFGITNSELRPRLGPYSLIHVLSVTTIATLVLAVHYAREGRIRGHRTALLFLTGGFLIAGIFTLAPARIMGRMVFGG